MSTTAATTNTKLNKNNSNNKNGLFLLTSDYVPDTLLNVLYTSTFSPLILIIAL